VGGPDRDVHPLSPIRSALHHPIQYGQTDSGRTGPQERLMGDVVAN
jgi:hypothetical protein